MTNDYRRLFTFDHWANERIGSAILDATPENTQEMARLFSHIIGAGQVWLSRIRDDAQPDLLPWPNIAPDLWPGALNNVHGAWIRLLYASGIELDRPIVYKNTKGQSFSTPLGDILTHVIIHGQHHRAQIALLLRQSGYSPPPTDFILFVREQSA